MDLRINSTIHFDVESYFPPSTGLAGSIPWDKTSFVAQRFFELVKPTLGIIEAVDLQSCSFSFLSRGDLIQLTAVCRELAMIRRDPTYWTGLIRRKIVARTFDWLLFFAETMTSKYHICSPIHLKTGYAVRSFLFSALFETFPGFAEQVESMEMMVKREPNQHWYSVFSQINYLKELMIDGCLASDYPKLIVACQLFKG